MMVGARAACSLLLVVAIACGGGDKKGANQPGDTPVPAAKASAKKADSGEASPDGTAKPDADAAQPLTEADFPVVFGVFQAMSRAVIDNAGNCDGMAKALQKVVASHETLLARLRNVKEDSELNDRFMAMFGPQIQQTMTQMAPIAQACGSHPGVKKVFEESL